MEKTRRPLRVAVDAGPLLAAFLFPEGPRRRLVEGVLAGRYRLVWCPRLWAEICETLYELGQGYGLDWPAALLCVRDLLDGGDQLPDPPPTFQPPWPVAPEVRHLAWCAAEAADFVVTDDPRLLALGPLLVSGRPPVHTGTLARLPAP